MSKIIIDDLLDETSFLTDANLRFQQIEDEFNNKVLYRLNPIGEPNGMVNDLDMQENDILNANQIDTKSIVLNGIPFDGSVNWGTIGGLIPDQTDLEARLVQAENAGVNDFAVSDNLLTSSGLAVTDDGNGNFSLSYTPAVNSSAYGLVRLNEFGKIDVELLEIGQVDLQGFFFSDDVCPKPIDTQGLPGLPVTPCGAPDYRNPSEIYGNIYNHGDAFIVSFNLPEISGSVNLIDPDNPLGPLIPIPVNTGDMLIYLEEVVVSGNTVIQAGWHPWYDAISQTDATNTAYDPAGNQIIIDPTDVNVDLALTTLDAAVKANKNHTEIVTGNPHNVTAIEAGAEPANANIQSHIVNTSNPHATDKTAVGLGNVDNTADVDKPVSTAQQVALDTKVAFADNPTVDGVTAGVIKMRYDSVSNTLFITGDGTNA